MSSDQKEPPNLVAFFLFLFPVGVPALVKFLDGTKSEGILWFGYANIGIAVLFLLLYVIRFGTNRRAYLIFSPILFMMGIFLIWPL